MPRLPRLLVPFAVLLLAAGQSFAAPGDTATDPKQADADYAIQGEYVGELQLDDGNVRLGVQVIALGEGKFQAVGHHGGLPGAGYNGEEKVTSEGRATDDGVVFESDQARGVIANGKLTISSSNGNTIGVLEKVERKSPTLGKKAPEGAVVLLDGNGADAWKGGKLTDEGHLMAGATSEQTFGDHTLHIEFRLPYMPKARGQGRGNSGIYLQGRYEVQMLDSFGLEGRDNECGGIYSVKAPDVNMCLPPLAWQTYDIDFTAARYDDSGKVTAPPQVTVRHNGVVIHENVKLPAERNTTAAPVKPGPEKGPIYLQNHGNPVVYRNIWVVEE